ncbi:MAG: 3-dehydroquinate synthase [Prevotella sp.]|nr:3-dehydroquinate synthase [Prevotella sp.]
MKQKVIISQNLEQELQLAIEEVKHDKLFVLTDATTLRKCWPEVSEYPCLSGAQMITIGAGDLEKNLESVVHVWEALQQGGATRHSLMINLGGGMVTDLGGFAASTFKRGISFINIPTTLLSMVDASVGGKTGFNFGGLKNEIGVFRDAQCVILCTEFLKTLDSENLRSGYAEMLKHGLIETPPKSSPVVRTSSMLDELLSYDITSVGSPFTPHYLPSTSSLPPLKRMLQASVAVKERIVDEDPLEQGIRKALNVGHTIGHAFESWAMKHGRPILHGYAVAYGIVAELYLSCVKCGFPQDRMRQVVHYIKEVYGTLPITCDDYPELIELMTHDKKNSGSINFSLLADVGDIRINQTATEEEIKEALDFYRDGQ